MKEKPIISRRSFLKGSSGIAIALPFLGAGFLYQGNRRVKASTPNVPVRFIPFFKPGGAMVPMDGWNPDSWFPVADANGALQGSDGQRYRLNAGTKNLESIAADLVFLRGLDLKRSEYAGNNPALQHYVGMAKWLTGRRLLTGAEATAGKTQTDLGVTFGYGSGISIDQYIANKLWPDKPRSTYEFGVWVRGANVESVVNYTGREQYIVSKNDPVANFNTLLLDIIDARDNLELFEQLRTKRRSALDTTLDEYRRLSSELDAEGRRRLEAHAEELRRIERSLQEALPVCAAQLTDRPDPYAYGNAQVLHRVANDQIDIMVMALKCQSIHIATLNFGWAWSGAFDFDFPAGITAIARTASHRSIDTHEALGHAWHDVVNAPIINQEIRARQDWYTWMFRELINRLRAVNEGESTLLDNSLIFWGSELSHGPTHSEKGMPFVLAGGAGGKLQGGRYILYGPNRPHNDLLVAMLHAFGINDSQFGDADLNTGAITGLFS